jgi:hypothetical protein
MVDHRYDYKVNCTILESWVHQKGHGRKRSSPIFLPGPLTNVTVDCWSKPRPSQRAGGPAPLFYVFDC